MVGLSIGIIKSRRGKYDTIKETSGRKFIFGTAMSILSLKPTEFTSNKTKGKERYYHYDQLKVAIRKIRSSKSFRHWLMGT